ncbi:MAG: HAMP domain-containing histidine kinase [Spirochaetales bacterium]|nr:HAMP domain-containing histidine kinase [Spirochaetales bacterium]
MDILPQEVVFIDNEFTILWMNKSKKKQHSKLRVGMKCFEAFNFTQQCDFCLASQARKIDSCIKNPVCLMTGRKKTKPRHINIMIAPLKLINTEVDGYIEVVDNVEALYQSHLQLEYLNREYESVIYALSHDLRSPLISIEGFLRKLQKNDQDAKDPAVFEHCVTRIHANVESMNNLVNMLLDTSRIITGKLDLQEVDMEEFIKHIIEDLHIRAGENNALITMQGKFGIENCDKIRIQQVFLNLISNALKHCSDTENLTIEIGSDGVMYWVKDNGPGMAPEIQEKLFEPFTQTTKTDPNSFGMGMNIVYKIIQKHEGDIWLESQEGKGTTVFFTLKADTED